MNNKKYFNVFNQKGLKITEFINDMLAEFVAF